MHFRPRVIYRDPNEPREDSVIRYIGNRVLTKNANFLCGVTGKTGAGKSWAVGSMSEIYSKRFNIPYDPSKQIFWRLEDMLRLIVNNEFDKILRVGSILQFEEPQTTANARKWQSQANAILNSLTSTFRERRLVVFFSLPYLNFLDKQTRMLLHAEFKVEGFDKNTGMTTVKPRFLDYNEMYDRFFTPRLIVEYALPNKQGHQTTLINHWKIPRPSKEWVSVYEPMKKAFSDQHYKNLFETATEQGKNSATDKARQDYNRLEQLYDKHGENYSIFMQEFGEYSPRHLQEWCMLIKRSKKAALTQAPVPHT